MSIIHNLRSSRLVKFLFIHAVISVAACAVVFSKLPHPHELVFGPYIVAFLQTFLGSLAGALLSLVQLAVAFSKGLAGAGTMNLFSRAVPLPIVAGISSLCAFIFAIAGMRGFGWKGMYFVFVLGSFFFLYSSYAYFSDPANDTKPMMGQPMFMQPEK